MSVGGPQPSEPTPRIKVWSFAEPQQPWGIRIVWVEADPLPLLGEEVFLTQRPLEELIISSCYTLGSAPVRLPHMRTERLAKNMVAKWNLWRKANDIAMHDPHFCGQCAEEAHR